MGKRLFNSITVSDVDSLLAQKVNAEHYARISIRSYASSIRSFFRYAEMRGWCPVGIATSIMAPRVFQHETLPSGPTWDIVQEILDATAGARPTEAESGCGPENSRGLPAGLRADRCIPPKVPVVDDLSCTNA